MMCFSSCMRITTILWHHVIGRPIGTASSTPSLISWSIPAFTAFRQCMGTGMEVCTATGSASVSIMSLMGGPCIIGSG